MTRADTMDDSIQAFVDQFRSLLQEPDQRQTAELVAALARFGSHCDEANRRLRECLALISKGQNANAVELAERDPNLLDCCTLLDIPERDMLANVARSLSSPAPALVARELVEALQEGYQKGSTAAGNRRLLHKLALARAPLPARLAVMRRLAVQDPNHPFLDADIRNFERAWFKQAPTIAHRAVSQPDPALIEEMVDDLQNSGYLETPPAALLDALQKTVWKARTAMLPALAESIRAAFRDSEFEKLKELVARWIVFAAAIPDAPARFQVADALDWVSKESDRQKDADERSAARARLSRLIASPGGTRVELESAYQTLAALGGMDAALDAAVQSRLVQIERRRLAGKAGKGAVALALVLVPVLALVFWNMSNVAQQREVATLVSRLTSLLQPEDPKKIAKVKSEDLQETLQLVANSQPAVAKDGKVAALRELAQKETDRREQLEKALLEIHDCPLGKDVGPLVAVARQQQHTRDEEKKIEKAEADWQERSSNQIAIFKQRAEDLLKRSDELAENAKRGQALSADNSIPKLRSDFESLQAEARQMEHHDHRLQSIRNSLDTVDNWQKFASPVHDFERAMRGVKPSSAALQRIAVHLKETIFKFCPNRAAQANAETAQNSLEMWNRILELGAALNQSGTDAASIDWSKIAGEWPGTPVSALVGVRERQAEMLRQRNFGFAGSSTAQLRELLNQKHMARVWMLRRDGSPETRYYFLTEPTANKQANYKAVAVVGFNGVTREVTVAQKNYRKPVLSPQSVVARDALAFLESKNQESWNKSLAEVFETLCRSPATDGIDPLIKLRLVHDFLLLSSKTSQGFRKQLDNLPAFKKLTANEAMSLAAGNWLDPREDDRLGQQRDKAAQLVEETPSLLPMLADADDFDRRQANIASQKESVSWIGWLAPGEHSPVAVVPFADRGNLRPGRIYVVANNKFIAIGSVVGDREALDDVAMEYLGYPVLAVAEVMDK